MLVLRNNFPEFPTMGTFLSKFFGEEFPGTDFGFSPKVRIKENDNDYTLSFALPGFKKEDIHIDIKDNILCVSSKVEKDDFKSSFESKYQIPEDVNMENIEASMEDGILKVKTNKYNELPSEKVKKIEIM